VPNVQTPSVLPESALALLITAQRLSLPDPDGRPARDAFVQNRPTGDFVLARQGDVLAGWLREKGRSDLRAQTLDVYRRLFAATDGWNPARVWNIVPAVNGEVRGVENYRAFNAGRAEAFAERFGDKAESRMCAASGVGGHDGFLDVSFVAVRGPVTHLENPEQIPAYRYPKQYGQKPPSFARATVCEVGEARIGFVSGTAAVKGYASVAGPLSVQCQTTIDNLRLMERALANNGLGENPLRHVNLFVRRCGDAPLILDFLAKHWSRPGDALRVHRADICRAELSLEIEFAAIRLPTR
jgi:chorismate lyase / 3-hydroxybenzoate synthase